MAFTDAFTGTPGNDLNVYNATNWIELNAHVGQLVIDPTGSMVRVITNAGGSLDSLYRCPDQGGSNPCWIEARIKDKTVNGFPGALVLRWDASGPASDAYAFYVNAGVLKVTNLATGSVLYTGAIAVVNNDVVAMELSGVASNTTAKCYVNGTKEAADLTGDASFAALHTRAGIRVLGGTGLVNVDLWDDFRQGVSTYPGPVASSTKRPFITSYSPMMRD
jgi:hypothetical protein